MHRQNIIQCLQHISRNGEHASGFVRLIYEVSIQI